MTYFIFSGADLSALVREAAVAALRQCMAEIPETTSSSTSADIRVEKSHFDLAFRKVVPSVSEQVRAV